MENQDNAVQPIGICMSVNIYKGIRHTLAQARTKACVTINFAMVEAYWKIGHQIDEAINERAEYGKGLLKFLEK